MRADFSLDYDVLTVQHPQKLYLMARFEADENANDNRRALNLSLVIDRSGSMAGDKIDYTKQAAQFLVQHLGSQDMLSIVLYNDKVDTLLMPERIENKDNVVQLIERIRVRGTTNLSGGWLEGCQHVASHLNHRSLNRVLLMSDGLANRGVTDQDMLVTMARQKRDEGVSTTAMGLGSDFNEELMMEMANAGGGAFYFIESPEVTPEIFREELSGLLNIVGQNLTIKIETTGDVSTLRQLNAYPVSIDGNVTSFSLGDIFSGELKTLVLELSIPALETLGSQQIATLYFDYDEIDGENTEHRKHEFPVMVNVAAAELEPPEPNRDVAQSVLLLQAAQARQEAVQAADRGDYTHASTVLRNMAKNIEESQVINDDLAEERQALIEQADKLERGAAAYTDYSRKTMFTQSYYTMTDRHDRTMSLRSREQQRENKDAASGAIPQEPKRQTMEQAIPKSDDAIDVERLPGVTPTHVRWNDQTFTLQDDVIRIGRSSHNEIVLDRKGVSRFHGQIKRRGDKLIYEDLDSTNGTTTGGNLIESPYELSVGDVLYLCDERLVFITSPNDPDNPDETLA